MGPTVFAGCLPSFGGHNETATTGVGDRRGRKASNKGSTFYCAGKLGNFIFLSRGFYKVSSRRGVFRRQAGRACSLGPDAISIEFGKRC